MKSGQKIHCTWALAAFSGHLDGILTGREMQSVTAHLEQCEPCAVEFAAWRGLQKLLAETGPVKAPNDLGLRLRLAISHEATRRQTLRDNLTMRWENLIRPAMLQVASGLAGAVILFGGISMLVGVSALPTAVLAHDEPLGAVTMPHYLYTAAQDQPVVTPGDTTIIVEADVNAEGRVYDWNVVAGTLDDRTRAAIRDELMLQVYEPATMFGEPVRGRVLVTFSGIMVHG